MAPVVVELENGTVCAGSRHAVTGGIVLPRSEEVRSGQLIRLDGEVMRVTWCANLSPEGPTLIGVVRPEMPPPNRWARPTARRGAGRASGR